MKFLCSWLGCKYVITETENSWSSACKRCGKGGGHGKSILLVNGEKVYSVDLNKQTTDNVYMPPSKNYEIIMKGGGGGGGGSGVKGINHD